MVTPCSINTHKDALERYSTSSLQISWAKLRSMWCALLMTTPRRCMSCTQPVNSCSSVVTT